MRICIRSTSACAPEDGLRGGPAGICAALGLDPFAVKKFWTQVWSGNIDVKQEPRPRSPHQMRVLRVCIRSRTRTTQSARAPTSPQNGSPIREKVGDRHLLGTDDRRLARPAALRGRNTNKKEPSART